MFSLADWFFEVQNQRPIVPAQSASRAALTDCQSQLSEFISCVAKRSAVGIVTVVSRGWSWVGARAAGKISIVRSGSRATWGWLVCKFHQLISIAGSFIFPGFVGTKAKLWNRSPVTQWLSLLVFTSAGSE